MKFITLLITMQVISAGDHFKDSFKFDAKFKDKYFRVEEIRNIRETLVVKVFDAYQKMYMNHRLCEIELDNGEIAVVQEDCDEVVKKVNGEK